MRTHKHKWYPTTLSQTDTQKSSACKCGVWKMENFGKDTKMKIIKWKIQDYKKV